MYCVNCGKEIMANALFCAICGCPAVRIAPENMPEAEAGQADPLRSPVPQVRPTPPAQPEGIRVNPQSKHPQTNPKASSVAGIPVQDLYADPDVSGGVRSAQSAQPGQALSGGARSENEVSGGRNHGKQQI